MWTKTLRKFLILCVKYHAHIQHWISWHWRQHWYPSGTDKHSSYQVSKNLLKNWHHNETFSAGDRYHVMYTLKQVFNSVLKDIRWSSRTRHTRSYPHLITDEYLKYKPTMKTEQVTSRSKHYINTINQSCIVIAVVEYQLTNSWFSILQQWHQSLGNYLHWYEYLFPKQTLREK